MIGVKICCVSFNVLREFSPENLCCIVFLSLFSLDRDSFPFDQQFNILMRFIVDQTQTPNLKVSIKSLFTKASAWVS